MANPIPGDNFSTHQALKQRSPDAEPRKSPAPLGQEAQTLARPSDDSTALQRASQRLSQEMAATTGNTISNPAEARQQAAALKDLINAAPRQAVAAHGGVGADAFEAAMARPTA